MKNTFKVIMLALAVVLCIALLPDTEARAAEIVDSGYCGGEGDGTNLTWTLDSEGTLTISGEGAMMDWPDFGGNIRISSVIIQEGVTSIGTHAFYDAYDTLVSVTIPASMKSIPPDSFNCPFVKSLYINDLISWCQIDFGHVGDGYSSPHFGIPLDREGTLYINGNPVTDLVIPNGVTSIPDFAFLSCQSLASVTLPESITMIGECSFASCHNLESVKISNGVTSIGNSAFSNCDCLTDISLPQSLTSIGEYAFCGCSFTSLKIPDSVLTIGEGAFSVSGLTDITIPDSVHCLNNGIFMLCHNLKHVTLPADINYIGESAFYYCENLISISIPASVKIIDRWAFGDCYSLTHVTIPNGVTEFGEAAFRGCRNMSSITIPKSVKRIGGWCFYEYNLNDVYYGGSKSEWESIDFGDGAYPTSAAIHYNSEGPRERVTDLDALLATDPAVYNDDLALIAANLSLKTYDNGAANDESVRGYLTWDLGFDEAHHAKIYSDNYGGSLAFTVATKDCTGSGADKVLVIAAQGSTNPYELLKDATALYKSTYKGYLVYDIVQDFYNAINEGLDHVLEHGKTYKVLVTGHSLGGAAANLAAASITDHGLLRYDAACPSVFGYTFGAVNSIRADSPVTGGYRNIHNVYNELDTFSPAQSGSLLLTGMGSRNGKFGQMEPFLAEYRTPEQREQDKKDLVIQALNHVNHDMSNYVRAIESDKVQKSILRPGNAGATDLYGYSVVACPVDVDVYCEGELVGRVVNNVVDETVAGVTVIVEDEVKFILYPDGRQYDLAITAFDDGSMVYYTQDTSGVGQVKTMTGVALAPGKAMTSAVGGDIEVPEVQLLVVDDENAVLAKIEPDGTERAVDTAAVSFGRGDVTDTGDAVLVSTVMENFTPEDAASTLCAALYCDGRMIATRVLSDVAVPTGREVVRAFTLDYPAETQGELTVKLFYLTPGTLAPMASCHTATVPE